MKRMVVRRLAFAALLLCVSVSQAERYTVPLLVPAGTSAEPQGVLRILNATDGSGSVEIYAIDDAGARSGPAAFTLNAWAAVQFTATDLQSGNAQSGLTGGIGTALGDARLEIETDLRIVPLSFVRAADGTLSAMHDTVRATGVDGSGRYTYEVPSFNPASDAVHASRLRLINPGDASASVTIGARDDTGAAASGGAVELTLTDGAAQTLTAQQLEAGDASITGQLGAGTGKWRLTVSSDRPIQVLNVVSSTFGHMNNLSTTAVAGSAPVDHGAFRGRFLDTGIGFQTDSGDFTFVPGAGGTFAETAERDGVTTSGTGSYVYAAQGPDAGRVAASYDDGTECAANLYFASRSAGWFARNCTAANDPDGHWLGGTWSVTDGDMVGDGDTENPGSTPPVNDDTPVPGSLGACQVGMSLSSGQSCTYPGTADAFSINVRGRGSFLDRLAGIRIRINNETINGREYDFEASHQGDGVWRIDRVAGNTEPPSGGGMQNTVPEFAAGAAPGNQAYTVGTAIDPLTLPVASGGNGTLTYSLTPQVPGLSFDPATRRLTGTPTAAGDYDMTYAVTDGDGDVASLAFTISVAASEVQVVREEGDVRTVEVTPPGLVHASVVDLEDFGPETHGERITQIFLDNSSCASLDQLWGNRWYLVDGVTLGALNASGIVRHTLKDDSGIFWSASDDSFLYAADIDNPQVFFEEGRPFHVEARVAAEWIRDHDTLMISSLENFTAEFTGNGFETSPEYCDDFDPDDPEGFIPLCGLLDDYIAHTGVGIEKTLFVGGIDTLSRVAQAAIREDGVFSAHTIFVESPDGSTSQATPVLAAYAANLAHANPAWSASELRTELLRMARQETVRFAAGSNAVGTEITEFRTVNVIRPFMTPRCPL